MMSLRTAYRDAVAQGMSPNRAVHMISRATGRPSKLVRRELGIR